MWDYAENSDPPLRRTECLKALVTRGDTGQGFAGQGEHEMVAPLTATSEKSGGCFCLTQNQARCVLGEKNKESYDASSFLLINQAIFQEKRICLGGKK